jgi:hypothetical protein
MSNRKWVIPLSQVPDELTVSQYIFANTDLREVSKKIGSPKWSGHIQLPIRDELQVLKADVQTLLNQYPAYSYPYGIAPSTDLYRMIYLTYNPRSLNPQISNSTPTPKEHFPAEKLLGINYGKNSYNDTLALFERTEIARSLSLGKFLDQFERTLVRSRIGIQSGLMANNKLQTELSWHVDENIFINTRLSVPIVSSHNFSIEYTCWDPEKGAPHEVVQSFDLIEGFAYSFDTGRPHRFVAKQPSNEWRVNLICGFSPWFDFDREAQAWVSNQFYGEMHPIDMVIEGHVAAFLPKNFAHRLSSVLPREKISEPGNAETHSYHPVT